MSSRKVVTHKLARLCHGGNEHKDKARVNGRVHSAMPTHRLRHPKIAKVSTAAFADTDVF